MITPTEFAWVWVSVNHSARGLERVDAYLASVYWTDAAGLRQCVGCKPGTDVPTCREQLRDFFASRGMAVDESAWFPPMPGPR